MMPDDASLHQLAGAIIDGSPVDWPSAESGGEASVREVIRELKVIAGIAGVHAGASLPSDNAPNSPLLAGVDDSSERIWGPLRLLEKIGEGAYGEVFRAWDTRLDREVALKLLAAGRASARTTSSIVHEGRLLARVRHPNVVTIYGAETIDGRVGLWMELVRGRTLEQILKRGTFFSAAEATRIGIDVCRAVSAVHGAGLLHRDIKAHNVMLADDGRVVLMDFGTGKERDNSSLPDLAGTPLYLAPELLAGGPATIKSDIYSLGVLLYHLVTKSYPVSGRTTDDMRRAHERNESVPVRTSRPEVRPALARVIEHASHRQPERRHADVDALARDLTALQPRPAIQRLRYALAAAVAVLVVALIASEVRARIVGDDRSLRSRLASWIGGARTPVEHPVIAVLPFKNVSREPGSSRLVDSLTAGLIQQLGVIDGLNVTYQRSAFMLRDKPGNLAEIGKRLGVNLVVNGEVQLSSDTLVIRAALLPVAGGEPLWNETLTREVRSAGDLTDVLTDIARTIVNELRLKLGPTQRRYSTDLVTYQEYLRARELRDMRAMKADEAIPIFEDVIRRDPSYAPAYAALAATYGGQTLLWPNPRGFGLSPVEATAVMEPLTRKALEIDPMLAEAHVSMGYMHTFALRWTAAETSFRRAIELDPTIDSVYGDFVHSTLEPWGRLGEALKIVQIALDADPLSLDLRRVLARIQLSLGRYDDALANCRLVVGEDADFPLAEELCASALVAKGRTSEALDLFNKRRHLNEGWIGYVYAVSGRRGDAEAIAAQNSHLPHRQALIYAGLGDRDRAFEALERIAALNPRRAASYLTYPELRVLRDHPRTASLRRKWGFLK